MIPGLNYQLKQLLMKDEIDGVDVASGEAVWRPNAGSHKCEWLFEGSGQGLLVAVMVIL